MSLMKRLSLAVACVVLVSCGAMPEFSDPGTGWTFVGVRKFRDKYRTRKVQVSTKRACTHIMLKVKKAGIHLRSVKVTFADGEKWEPWAPTFVAGGGGWTDFKIRGGPRKIANIMVRCRSLVNDHNSFVRFYVRKESR